MSVFILPFSPFPFVLMILSFSKVPPSALMLNWNQMLQLFLFPLSLLQRAPLPFTSPCEHTPHSLPLSVIHYFISTSLVREGCSITSFFFYRQCVTNDGGRGVVMRIRLQQSTHYCSDRKHTAGLVLLFVRFVYVAFL